MKTQHTFTINYADTDNTRHIRLYDLERYILEAAGASADIMGFGTDFVLERYNGAWVITRLTLQINTLPTYLQTIRIETWVEGNMHMLSVRNYRIYLQQEDGSETLIGEASSVWTLLNLTTRQVEMKAFNDPIWEGKIDGEKISFPRISRLGKIDEPTTIMPHTIHYSDLDYNGHCNSCKYLQFFLNADYSLTATTPIRLDINYAKEVHLNEQTSIQVLHTDATDELAENGIVKTKSIQYCLLTSENEISATALLQRL